MRARLPVVAVCLVTLVAAAILLVPRWTSAALEAPGCVSVDQLAAAGSDLAPSSDPIQVTLRPPTDDAYGDQLAPSANFGDEPELYAARYLFSENYYHRLSAIRFDLSPIPAGSTIDSATLRLGLTAAAGLSTVSVGASMAAGYIICMFWGGSPGTRNRLTR